MSEKNKAAVIAVLVDACAATEDGMPPGNAKLAWKTVDEVAKAGGITEADAQDGLDTGIRQGLVLKGTDDHEGKYALNDPDLDQTYTEA